MDSACGGKFSQRVCQVKRRGRWYLCVGTLRVGEAGAYSLHAHELRLWIRVFEVVYLGRWKYVFEKARS